MDYLLESYKRQFEESKEKINIDRVFLLGAGFSRDFGFTTADTILNGSMEFLERDPRINTRNRWNNVYDFPWHSWHLHRLQDFLVGTMIDRRKLDLYSFLRITSEPYVKIRCHFFSLITSYLFAYLLMNQVVNEKYIRFINSLKPNDAIITLNWDVIPEVLMRTQNIEFTRHEWTSEKIMIVKLHGSVDLLSNPSEAMFKDFHELPQRFELLTPDLWRAVTAEEFWPRPGAIFKKLWPWEKYDKHGLFIVPPYETSGYKFDYIKYNWERAACLLNNCKKIIAIGYSFSDEDIKMRQLLKEVFENSKKIFELWNPNQNIRKKVKGFLGEIEISGADIPFSETPYMK